MNANKLRQKPNDFTSEQFPLDLKWSPAEKFNSLQRLFEFADTHCTQAIRWYNASKRSKQKFGYGLRFLAIIAVAIAGIIPVMSEIICRQYEKQCISPAWATVSIALGALFIALDRFAGYTSGWVRYVRSAQKLTELQGQFRLEWCVYMHSEVDGSFAQSGDGGGTREEPRRRDYGILLCKEYIDSVNSVVSYETDAWAQEFQQVLIQFEKPSNQGTVVQGLMPDQSFKQDPVHPKLDELKPE
jgi:hypothetical protein